MKKIIRLTESDLTRIVKRVIMEEDLSGLGIAPSFNPTTTTTPPSNTAKPISGAGSLKTITLNIKIDCSKKLIMSSPLPKLPTRESNLAMSQALIAQHCQTR